MDFFQRDDEPDEMMSQINIIPLVDVMLVLLIVFMVAAPLSLSGIPVNLPSTQTRSQSAPSQDTALVVSVTEKGEFFLDKKPIALKNLSLEMAEKIRSAGLKKLIIRADKDVVYERVVEAMNAGKQAGIDKMSLVVVAEDMMP